MLSAVSLTQEMDGIAVCSADSPQLDPMVNEH